MKVFSAVLLLVAVVTADYEPIELDYHDHIGIPLAEKLKNAENAPQAPESRISGGTPVGPALNPYLVGIVIDLTNGDVSICGGAMLSNTRSVTAAHCWKSSKYEARQFILAFGSSNIYTGGTRVTTTEVEVHPKYDTSNLNNDIAMISHDEVDYTKFIKAVSLPSTDLLSDQFVGRWAWATGFGNTSEDDPEGNDGQKNRVSLQVITNTICAETYGTSVIIDSSLCVNTYNGRGTCSGDSGSPLTITHNSEPVLIGVSSFESKEGCEKGFPAVFARVTSFVPWIQEKLAEKTDTTS